MTSVDHGKLQPGDQVTLRMTLAERNHPIGDFIQVRSNPEILLYGVVTEILTHTPRPSPLAPGDRVRVSPLEGFDATHRSTGRLIAIDGDMAWVRWNEDKGSALVRNDVIGVTFLERAQ